MFTVDYNSQNPEANVLVKQQDIFQNTLTIKSVHCYFENIEVERNLFSNDIPNGTQRHYHSSCCSIHNKVPIDIIYKSSPQGEKIFIALWGDATSQRLIFNIDGKSNIDLICQEDIRENFGRNEWSSEANDSNTGKLRYDEEKQRFYQQRGTGYDRMFFELSREQLEKLCSATILNIQSSSQSGEIQFEGDASGFITIIQALYNEAFDNSMYIDAKGNALSFAQRQVSSLQYLTTSELKKENWWIWAVLGGVVFLILFTIIITSRPL